MHLKGKLVYDILLRLAVEHRNHHSEKKKLISTEDVMSSRAGMMESIHA